MKKRESLAQYQQQQPLRTLLAISTAAAKLRRRLSESIAAALNWRTLCWQLIIIIITGRHESTSSISRCEPRPPTDDEEADDDEYVLCRCVAIASRVRLDSLWLTTINTASVGGKYERKMHSYYRVFTWTAALQALHLWHLWKVSVFVHCQRQATATFSLFSSLLFDNVRYSLPLPNYTWQLSTGSSYSFSAAIPVACPISWQKERPPPAAPASFTSHLSCLFAVYGNFTVLWLQRKQLYTPVPIWLLIWFRWNVILCWDNNITYSFQGKLQHFYSLCASFSLMKRTSLRLFIH